MNSPFVFNVAELLHGRDSMVEQRRQVGPSPSRIGPEMIAIPEGGQVIVDATLTPLGSGIMADATVTATAEGQCVRCLKTLEPTIEISVNQVFSADDNFIVGDDEEIDDESTSQVVGDEIDLEQAVIDEVGLSLPFNPTCEGGCSEDSTDVPAPDGVSGEIDDDDDAIDPRWAGLEKFL